jgi:two-component system phosphate regulon sensor histidine kinase PhoR
MNIPFTRNQFFYRLIFLITLAFIVAFMVLTIVMNLSITRESKRQTEEIMSQNLNLIRLSLRKNNFTISYLQELTQTFPYRVTLIAQNGQVLFDNQVNAQLQETMADRPEFKLAKNLAVGKTLRYTRSGYAKGIFLATRLSNDTILRMAVPIIDIRQEFGPLKRNLSILIAVIFLATVITVFYYSRKFLEPFREFSQAMINFAKTRTAQKVFLDRQDELGQLALAYNQMVEETQEHIVSIEKKSSETDAILKSLEEGVIAVDGENFVIYYNQAAEKILGSSIQNFHNQKLSEIIFHTAIVDLVQNTRTQKQPLQQEYKTPGTLPKTLLLSTAMIPEIAGVVVVIKDVSDLRKLENYRREFVANVTHELKTPITSIQASAETLQNFKNNDADQKRFLQIIEQNTQRLNGLISDILILAKLDSEVSFPKQKLSLNKILDAVLSELTLQISAKKMQIEKLTPTPEIFFWGDPEGLRQAFKNYLDNAIKYSPENQSIRLELRQTPTEIYFSVSDHGAGISAEHLPRLFERFYRTDKGRSINMGGTGLGLAIVKNVVERHGGKVGVESVPGTGSTFSFTLPVA